MKRKDFLFTTLAAVPAVALGRSIKIDGNTTKSFRVNTGQARFGEVTKFKGVHPNDIKISGKDTNGQLAVFEYTGLDKVGPSLHMHFDQDEIFYVTEGEYRFVVGNETQTLKAGDTIFLPRKVSHTWIQLSDKGKLLYWLQPAGNMEDFFRTMSSLKTPPTHTEVEKIHLEHGMKLLGPPLTL